MNGETRSETVEWFDSELKFQAIGAVRGRR